MKKRNKEQNVLKNNRIKFCMNNSELYIQDLNDR